MEPNYAASISFLQRWTPGGPWVLTAIVPDRKGIDTATFVDEGSVLRWLTKHGTTRNVYFSVNPCLGEVRKKPLRTDVKEVAWLHVDIDPRVGEDLEEERVRIVTLLTTNLPQGVPLPTVVGFSGGGYQGFWRLKKPFAIDGVVDRAEEAKLWNLQLEVLFSADPCHNVDRIMRLPGTLNRPDEKKRKKGRTIQLAEVVEFNDRAYDLSEFTRAPPVQVAGGGFGKSDVEVSGNVKRFPDVDTIPGISDKCRVLIVQGHDPDDPTKYPSRSEPLFRVVCELVRREMSNDEIYSVITDPAFGISASVLEKKSGLDKYAKHQIRRARERAIAPELLELNERHAVISDMGGKCLVATEREDPVMKRTEITFSSFEAIRNRYSNRKKYVPGPKDVPVPMPLGKWWLGHENRRQYDSIVFSPGRETPGDYNLWKGFACEARPGKCGLFLEHLRTNLCRGDEGHYRYLVGWMARAVQFPWKPGQVAVVLRGKQGTGKGFFARIFGSLWGRHYLPIADQKHLVGSFNAHLEDCVVLFSDEAIWAGDKKHEGILKSLITELQITVERKGVDVYTAPNCIHLILASNEDWIVPTGLDDRRFFALDVSDDHKKDVPYFRSIEEEMDRGGREALLHYLMTYDLSGFQIREVPQTALLQEQKVLSMGSEEDWWLNKLREGVLRLQDEEWTGETSAAMLFYDYSLHVQQRGRRSGQSKLGTFLQKAVPGDYPKIIQKRTAEEAMGLDGRWITIKRPRYYLFPPLVHCRKHWDENFGGPYDWDVPIEHDGKEVPF